MKRDEFDTWNTLTALTTGCYMLKELTDEMEYDIPEEIQESFDSLRRALVEIHNQVQAYCTSRKSTYIDDED